MISNSPILLASLLAQLVVAVQAGDRSRAQELAQVIYQQIATQAADGATMERQVRALLLELDTARPQIDLPDLDDFFIEKNTSAATGQGVVYPVWFGTNRKPAVNSSNSTVFTAERHSSVSRGRVLVHVPKTHRFGETGSGFWKRLLRFDLTDDNLRIQEVVHQERDAFFTEIAAAMQAAHDNGNAPDALFFLHGFNVTFEDAAIRAAQIGYDLKMLGATAFFSWPSRGSVAAYPADEATIEASEQAITNFLVDFSKNCGAEKIHIIAHSMGNRGLLRVLQRIAANAQTKGKVKFGQIFLAAPDIDRDLFLDLAPLYAEHSERTTLYASDGDLAVHLSAELHGAPRAGYFTPYTVSDSLDTVAVPNFNIDMLGHGYFAQAEALLYDIYDLMRHGQAPDKRQRISSTALDGAFIWQLGR